jgi:hypothetical protein
MKTLLTVLLMSVVAGCTTTTASIDSQYDKVCAAIRASHKLFEGQQLSPNLRRAFDTADTICVVQPRDVASAMVTLAAVYLTITRAQEQKL